jgi:hypothetical protein
VKPITWRGESAVVCVGRPNSPFEKTGRHLRTIVFLPAAKSLALALVPGSIALGYRPPPGGGGVGGSRASGIRDARAGRRREIGLASGEAATLQRPQTPHYSSTDGRAVREESLWYWTKRLRLPPHHQRIATGCRVSGREAFEPLQRLHH